MGDVANMNDERLVCGAAFDLILCRPPTTREVEQAKRFLVKAAREQKIDPLASLALVLFNTNEFSYR